MPSLSDNLAKILNSLRVTVTEPTWETVEVAIVEAARVATAHERAKHCLEVVHSEREACAAIVENANGTRWKTVDQALLYCVRMIRLRNKL